MKRDPLVTTSQVVPAKTGGKPSALDNSLSSSIKNKSSSISMSWTFSPMKKSTSSPKLAESKSIKSLI